MPVMLRQARPRSFIKPWPPRRVRSVASRMQLERSAQPGREPAQPGKETSTLTGSDTPRGHGGSSPRHKSSINARIAARATEEDIVMDANSRRKSSENAKTGLKNHLEDIENNKIEKSTLEDNELEKILPWLSEFNKGVRSCAGSRNYQHLEELFSFYTQNILSSVAKHTITFNDEINKLMKNHINKMLIFFHLYWLDIKQDIADHSQYLNKISALLNVYIDMELKTSVEERTSSHRVVRDSSEIAAKILAALYIYLDNSKEHIFRVLLRIKHTTEICTKVYNHIFTKSFTNLETKMTSITDVAYIRYFLAFKIWRKMEETKKVLSDEGERINKLALMLLGPHIPKLQDELLKFLPPLGQENKTLWLIQSQFDIEQAHKQFLLFEDKMDDSTDLQFPIKVIHADENFSKSQTNSAFRRSNSTRDTSEQSLNNCLSGLRNNNTLPNNKNKSLDQTYLQKKGSKSRKLLKKERKKLRMEKIKKRENIEIIDLTRDDEITAYKTKRKKTKQNSECLKVENNISKKHINSSKHPGKLMNSDVKEYPNENNKSLGEKIYLEPTSTCDIKLNDTENCTSVSNKSSFNDIYHTNLQENNQMSNTHLKSVKEDENMSYDNSIIQNKDALTSQEESAMETIPFFDKCQNKIANRHSVKQEILTSTNCATSYQYCNTIHDIRHFLTCVQTKTQFIYIDNDFTIINGKTLHLNNLFNNNENDAMALNNKNICICNCVKNHTGEHIVTTSAEKRMQYLNNSKDTCTVSTTSTEDQIVETSLDCQHVNSDNRRKCEVLKYSKDTMEAQQGSDCDTSMSNKQLYSSEPYTSDSKVSETDSKGAITFLHDNQTLEDMLLNNIINFPPVSELGNVYRVARISNRGPPINYIHRKN